MAMTNEELIQQNEDLQARLEAAEEALRAIQSGEVDALVIYREDGDQVYTLEGADHTYRVMVEKIQEGVATLQPDGMILYANQRLAEMLGVPLESLLGTTLLPFIQPYEYKIFTALLHKGVDGASKGEMTLQRKDRSSLPVLLSMTRVENKGEFNICLVATDLTEQKRQEEILASERLARSILEQAAEAIVVCDMHGTIIRASQATESITQENPLFQPFNKIFPLTFNGNERAEVGFSIEAVLKGHSYRGIEARLEPGNSSPVEAAYRRNLLLSAAPLQNERDEILGCILSITDITARKQAEEALLESERKYRDLIRYAPVGIYEVDFRKRRFVSINDVMCQLTGYTREEMMAMDPMAMLDDRGKRTFQERIAAWLAGRKPEEGVEYIVKAKDGHEIVAVLNVTFKADNEGQPMGATVVGYDMTERKKYERELLEATRRAEENQLILEAVIQQMPAGIILTNATGSQARNNSEMDRIWRRAMLPDEHITQHEYHAFHADGSEYTLEEWPLTRSLMQAEVVRGEEMTILRGDGTRGTLNVNSAPIKGTHGEVIAGIVIDVDITERKQAEQRIAEEKEWFRTTLASIGDAVITTDPQERVTYLNPVAEQLTGWTTAAAAGLPMERIFPIINEQTGQPVGNPVGKVLQSGRVVGLANHTALRSRDGRIIPIEDSAAPIRDADGRVLGVIMVFHDVTHKREAAEALRMSEIRYRSLVENSLDGILLTQPDGTILSANAQACQLFGMTEAELIEAGRGSVTVQDERFAAAIAQRNTDLRSRAQLTLKRKDGTTFIADVSSGIFTDPDGSVKTSMMIRDITQLKQIEAERERLLVETSHQKVLLERLIENAPLGIALLEGPEHRFILANPAQHRLFPTIPQFVGRTVQDIWPDQADVFNPILDRVSQTGEAYYAVDAPWQTDRGQGLEEAFYTFSYSPLYTANGDNAGIMVLSLDTTDQVKARQQIEAELAERWRIEASLRKSEEQLRESQERLLMTTGAVEIGFWDWDVIGKKLDTDARCKSLFGQPPDSTWVYADYIQAVHAEDRRLVGGLLHAALDNRSIYETEFRVVWPDESVHWIYSKGQAVYNDAGEPLQMLGIMMDISARKAVEAEILSSQAHIEVQHRLIEQREQERQQIARDLHDGPVQALIGATFSLQSLVMDDCPPQIAQQLDALRSTLQEQISELRAYAGELRPPILTQFGLVKAIQAHLETFHNRHPEIQVHFEESSAGPLLPEQARLALFRITQETLNNIVKHAQATQATIRLRKTLEQVSLEIEDNGVGFEIPQDWLELARQKHLGLVGMRERAEALGGSLQVTSQPGQGTKIRVVVRVNHANESSGTTQA